jgi:hypothetical protein
VTPARLAASRTLARHFNSAFSRGVGYEAQPPGPAFEKDRIRGYFIDFRAKTTSPSAAEPGGLVPAGLAQLALGWWERMLGGESHAREEFERVCDLCVKRAERHGEELRWRYETVSPKYPPSESGRYSSLAQAQMASVFVRAHVALDESYYADRALAAIRPLLETSSEMVAETPDGPVLEEAPSEPPSHVLNGWIYALWGLHDVEVALGLKRAGEMKAASIECLRKKLPSYDIGWWTKYSLYPHRLADLAKPFYHRLHVDQLDVMYRLTGIADFREAGSRWRTYDTPVRRVAVIAQKAAFVATGFA